MRVIDARGNPILRRLPRIGIGALLFPLVLVFSAPCAFGEIWNGSMQMDYQSAPKGGRGSLTQRYYILIVDQLFHKNQLSFMGTFEHHGRQGGQLAQFRPRYEWLLSSYGYGGQLVYEPFTQQHSGESADQEVNRRWRAGVYIQPQRWPRFAYDFLQTSRRTQRESGREHWDSYLLSWQPGPVALAGGYSRQLRTAQGLSNQLAEVYRASALAEQRLPWHHRLSLSYNFDRTWNGPAAGASGAQDQHTGTVGLNGEPGPGFSWTAQYSGRFLTIRQPGAATTTPTDHLASGTINWMPATAFSASISRYFERTGPRNGEAGQHTDFWQGRASAEGKLYRQMKVLASAYRIVYSGAPKGARYNDAYFLAVRGKPFQYADWSTELSLGDRHGRQTERFAGNLNTYARLHPLASVQAQIGYSTLMSGVNLDAFRITEDSYNTNVQYLPSDNMTLSGTWSLRRNHAPGSKWNTAWSLNGSYRWPSFASLSVNYSERQVIVPIGGAATPQPGQRPSTLIGSIVWWVGPNTTVNGQYSRQTTSRGVINRNWGAGISTSF